MTLLIVFLGTWLLFGLLHYALVMKDWRHYDRTAGLRSHAWFFALVAFVPLVLYGPVGLVIRDWTRRRFPHWYR